VTALDAWCLAVDVGDHTTRVIDFALWLAPGAVVTGAAIAGCRIARHTAGWIYDRHQDRRGIRRLEHFANHPTHRSPRKEDRP
jgi:hypothetical protein